MNQEDKTRQKKTTEKTMRFKASSPTVPNPANSLSRQPRQSLRPMLVVNKALDSETPKQVVSTSQLSDKERLWNQICAAKSANDDSTADFLLRIYLSLPKDETPPNTNTLQPPSVHRSASATASLPTQKQPLDKSINFIRGSIPNHCDIGFTPFFDKNIREFKGPLLLEYEFAQLRIQDTQSCKNSSAIFTLLRTLDLT
ncbi:uncharacterized protein PGTG_04731 [Puccinia graminis f. sp. tritici CRL 75-36-700-3]|uniref:Uncharacterized protein n=1 Tax=Puccinia graminis f. sp. tritici (strain CRL 75-36-700-3 / race SCCL) TaxID=418459 RepID=E3K3X3_PUCGT|nr:uncharacterized protein PGTG_04731 [Puccinia graminis f. sp. tritici CRL 75-36-700-3]EFP78775.1 hypothetical protein PGTG_04731 [Puccinia graminis f. sp. tritici CRL 75-36-700-3]